MGSQEPRRILIVANRTAATPALIDEVRRRAADAPCHFTLLVPRTYWDPDTDESTITLELALPLLDEAAGSHVEGLVGDNDPFVAVAGALRPANTTSSSSPRCRLASPTGSTSTCPRECSASDCR